MTRVRGGYVEVVRDGAGEVWVPAHEESCVPS